MSGEQKIMSDLSKEVHNYLRVCLAAVFTCIIALVGVSVTAAVWAGKIETRVASEENRNKEQDGQLAEINTFQKDVNARLATIEERTGTMVKGIDRIEDSLREGKRKAGQ